MGDSGLSGYHLEAQRKARILQKKNEIVLQQSNFGRPTQSYNPTVGDCLQTQGNSSSASPILQSNSDQSEFKLTSFDYDGMTSPQLGGVKMLDMDRRSPGGPGLTGRSSTTSRRTATPLNTFHSGDSSRSGSAPRTPQTPNMNELLWQRQATVYSTDMFPEYEDDRELFDTFTFI